MHKLYMTAFYAKPVVVCMDCCQATTHLCECHPGDNSKHYLLPFSGVGVLLVLLQPGLQGAGGLPGGRFSPGRVPVRVLTVRVEALGGMDR